jgi:hypothetical protein
MERRYSTLMRSKRETRKSSTKSSLRKGGIMGHKCRYVARAEGRKKYKRKRTSNRIWT